MSIRTGHALLLVALTACASAGSTPAVRRDSNLLTQQEIMASNEGNAYDAIASLRPLFLRSRGRTTINAEASDYATVFVDGQRYGDLNSLRGIVASQVIEARYLTGTEAVAKYGMRYGSGVIDIRTR
jgi:hypothetical protein